MNGDGAFRLIYIVQIGQAGWLAFFLLLLCVTAVGMRWSEERTLPALLLRDALGPWGGATLFCVNGDLF